MITVSARSPRSHSSPVFQGEPREFAAIVDPFKLEGPAALCHTGQDQAVTLQVNLGLRRLHLKVRWNIVYWKRIIGEKKGR